MTEHAWTATFDGTSVELAAGGTASLSVDFDLAAAADASAAEHVQELLVARPRTLRAAGCGNGRAPVSRRNGRQRRRTSTGMSCSCRRRGTPADRVLRHGRDEREEATGAPGLTTTILGRRLPPGEAVQLTKPTLVGADADELGFYATSSRMM